MSSLFRTSLFLIAVALVLSGCGKESSKTASSEPTRAMRAEAALLLSEAEFAVQLRDHARAEPLLAKAVSLVGDNADHWIMLGATRRRLGNIDGARKAYREALAVLDRDYKKTPDEVGIVLEQIYVHALLGQKDQARALLDKAAKRHASSKELQEFIRVKSLDRLLEDRAFKEIAL
jgi:tetratricopeptide (TPR) repeat protein